MVEIARLLRGSPAGPAGFDPTMAAAERMLDLTDRLCAERPLVLIAEDLHWADELSPGLWSRLARAVDQIPVLLWAVSSGQCNTQVNPMR
jgi:predicted ATPase